MFFAYSRDSATPYYNLLGILKFEKVYKLKVALFTHKILNGSTNISTISSVIDLLREPLRYTPTIPDLPLN